MLLVLVSCSDKNNDQPNPVPDRKVTFEITGNYTGKLNVIISYSGISGGLETVEVSSLPWSLTKEYPSSIAAVGIGGNGSVTGVAGQSITTSIKAGNVVKSQSQSTADIYGGISIKPITYVFQ